MLLTNPSPDPGAPSLIYRQAPQTGLPLDARHLGEWSWRSGVANASGGFTDGGQ